VTRVPVAPTIAPDVREYIAAEIALAGGLTEVGFVCSWDAATKVVASAELIWRGASDQVPSFADDLRAGELELHNHPHCHQELWPLVPSKADLDNAVENARRGVGTAIVDKTAERLYVIREPIRPRMLRDLDANPKPRVRQWSWWRFSLFYSVPSHLNHSRTSPP
jgi:hypothetical protein